MSYLSAPTPPSTPTCNIVQISQYENKTKSSKHLQSPLIIDTNLPTVNMHSPTTLDILSQNHNYNHINHINIDSNAVTPYQPSESDDYEESDTDQVIPNDCAQMWPHNPPQITLYDNDSAWIEKRQKKHKTTMDTDGEDVDEYNDEDDDDEHDIEREPSQSSLCCTLYPYETEYVSLQLSISFNYSHKISFHQT